MGKVLSGELSCPCDRSCFATISVFLLKHDWAECSSDCNTGSDKRGIEDNAKIIFLISQQKHIL